MDLVVRNEDLGRVVEVIQWMERISVELADWDDTDALSDLATRARAAREMAKIMNAGGPLRRQATLLELHALRRIGRLGSIDVLNRSVDRQSAKFLAGLTELQAFVVFTEALQILFGRRECLPFAVRPTAH